MRQQRQADPRRRDFPGYYGSPASGSGIAAKNAILKAINDSIPTPIFVKDREGRIIYANPATLQVLGKTEAEVINYRDREIYPQSELGETVTQNDLRIMESGETEVVEESPDGIRTFLGMKTPYRNEAGEIVGLVGISNDITARVQLERDRERILQQEQAAREAAEKANRIKDEFLAVLSHELRTPLNPILGWSKLLLTGKIGPAKTVDALRAIERNAQLQSQLIEDLLDVSRILQGKLSLNVIPVNLKTPIEAAAETVQLAATAKKIQIQTIFDSDVGQVSGDPARLQQIVWNLLSNSVKFTPAGGRIEVLLKQVESRVCIQVIDSGKGIHREFLPMFSSISAKKIARQLANLAAWDWDWRSSNNWLNCTAALLMPRVRGKVWELLLR
ncbi:MAG: PAS domain-containing protein [Microcoleus sp. SU_5_6]|nr:PAS domain-containing protein [Microcoleus sp. SU_5_6]